MIPSLQRHALAILTAAILAIATPTAVGATYFVPARSGHPILAADPPMCGGGVGTMLLGGPSLYGPGGPGAASGRFVDAIGSEWVITGGGASACPGLPSDIDILSPVTSTTCGSMESLTFDVTDTNGSTIQDGTTLSLSTSLGTVPDSVTTQYGLAYASFLAPSTTAGKAEIIVRAGAVIAIKTIEVTCS